MKKISSKSLYSKIEALLGSVKGKKFTNRKELLEYVKDLNQQVFFVNIYQPPPVDDMVPEFSVKSLDKVFRISMALGLLDENGLTESGKLAIKKNNFDAILSEQVFIVLRSNNIDMKTLNKIISGFLKEKIPSLPTSLEIYKHIQENSEIKYSFFSKLLILLANTGYARTSQTKIYLEFSSE